MRRSISRTFSRYSSSRARSRGAEAALQIAEVLASTESRMLRVLRAPAPAAARRCPAARTAARTPTRGLISIGSGVVGVRPRDRVHVGAAVARAAAADVAREVLGGDLDRRERRVLSDLLRDRPDRSSCRTRKSSAFGLLRRSRRSASAADAVAWLSSMPGRSRLLTTTTLSLNGSSGFRIGVKSKPVPAVRRRPVLHDGAVRNVDRTEPRLRAAPPSAPAP